MICLHLDALALPEQQVWQLWGVGQLVVESLVVAPEKRAVGLGSGIEEVVGSGHMLGGTGSVGYAMAGHQEHKD